MEKEDAGDKEEGGDLLQEEGQVRDRPSGGVGGRSAFSQSPSPQRNTQRRGESHPGQTGAGGKGCFSFCLMPHPGLCFRHTQGWTEAVLREGRGTGWEGV